MNEIIQRYIEQYKFSDIHLKENQPVMLRVNGDMFIPEEKLFPHLSSGNFHTTFLLKNSYLNLLRSVMSVLFTHSRAPRT